MKNYLNNLRSISVNHNILKKEIQDLKLLTGKQMASLSAIATDISKSEFKVFSQWGDDGMIQYLINNIIISEKYFIEFGVENYTEANTRFLLMNNNWSGLIMDGSASNIDYVRNDHISWQYDLKAKHAFVTAENINELITSENAPHKIGLLHIDIDGNDYWIWKKINCVVADIVIVEYNSLFGCERSITIPYQPNFTRTAGHYSNLFYGTSLLSLCDLAKEKGYTFVGCNSAGNNAYFVLNEKLGSVKAKTIEEGYVLSKFREARDQEGKLTFVSGEERKAVIKGMDVFNTRTNKIEKF